MQWQVLEKGRYLAPSVSASSDSVPSYSASSHSAPSYSAPAYSAPSYQKAKVDPYVMQKFSMHMVPVPKTYAAPKSYAAASYSVPFY